MVSYIHRLHVYIYIDRCVIVSVHRSRYQSDRAMFVCSHYSIKKCVPFCSVLFWEGNWTPCMGLFFFVWQQLRDPTRADFGKDSVHSWRKYVEITGNLSQKMLSCLCWWYPIHFLEHLKPQGLPSLLSSSTDFLPFLNLLCHLWMTDGQTRSNYCQFLSFQ